MTAFTDLRHKTIYRGPFETFFVAFQYGPKDWELYRMGDLGREKIGGFRVFPTGELFFLYGEKDAAGRYLVDPNKTGATIADFQKATRAQLVEAFGLDELVEVAGLGEES